MRRSSPTGYRAAFTLPEILVSLFLVSIVLAALGGLLREAVRFYTDQSVTLEVQKNCLFALTRLGAELREASADSLDTGTPNQITFGSPRDQNGLVQYKDGKLLWHKYIRFSIQNVKGSSVLVREDDLLDTPATIPPNPGFSNFSVPDVQAVQARLIDSLTVVLDGNNAEVEIKARYRDLFEMNLQTEIKLRN